MKMIYNFPVGDMIIEEDGIGITRISLCDKKSNLQEEVLEETPLLRLAKKQLDEYFCGRRKVFDLPVSFRGTPFQQKVWNALRTIPYGETRSYQDIARMTGNEKACRAVGMANNRNSILIVVPCHRVIGKDGKLVGFGCGLEIKEYLLGLEKNFI